MKFSDKTVILADGRFPSHKLPLEALRAAKRVVCCDGAAAKLLRFGMVPTAIVGDFDSLSAEIRERYSEILVHEPSQESNDLSKAFEYCISRGWREVVILGLSGTREDHTIGNIALLADYVKQAPGVVAVTDGGVIHPMAQSGELAARVGQAVSIFSLEPRQAVTGRGLRWPVEGLKLDSWWQATLNKASSEKIALEFEGQPIIVYLAHDTEADVGGVAGSDLPVTLTIAGSDSGGNAGLQADLRSFHVHRVHGCTAITAMTAQNPDGVYDIQLSTPDFLRGQLEAIFKSYDVKALKTGMLGSTELIEVAIEELAKYPQVYKVIDPVMVATSGAHLLSEDAVATLRDRLLPLATLVTPNLPEAEILAERKITSEREVEAAARYLVERHGCNVIIKGGHNATAPARDHLCIREGGKLRSWWLESVAVENPVSTHGTGCTLSSSIAANLSLGWDLLEAVIRGKAFVLVAIRTGRQVGAGETATVLGQPEDLPVELIACYEQML